MLIRYIDKLTGRYPEILTPDDDPLISDLKRRFIHSEREFHHRERKYIVDSLYCHAVPGTLETGILKIRDLSKKEECDNRLLNVGGGTGQLSQILSEIGFEVVNVDIEVRESDFHNILHDLNSPEDIPVTKKFDVVYCQEVIEHVENPWLLFRKICNLLTSDGRLIVTMPNIHSTKSVKIFKKSGHFHWFTPDCLSYHINPISIWELELIAEKNGLKVVEMIGNGEYYFGKNDSGRIADNECLIFVIRKKD